MTTSIAAMQTEDWEAARSIYEDGIKTGNATFERQPPEWDEWDRAHLGPHRWVARQAGEVVGWAALSPVSGRCVYSGVAELSVYIAPSHRGKGVGSLLMSKLIESSERDGIWTLQAGVFPENTGSLGLLFKYGFKEVGLREKLGRMSFGPMEGKWRDVILLERRSRTAGVD